MQRCSLLLVEMVQLSSLPRRNSCSGYCKQSQVLTASCPGATFKDVAPSWAPRFSVQSIHLLQERGERNTVPAAIAFGTVQELKCSVLHNFRDFPDPIKLTDSLVLKPTGEILENSYFESPRKMVLLLCIWELLIWLLKIVKTWL